MKLHLSLRSGLAVICLVTTTQGHTWLEQIRLIASNGTFVGAPGYPRAFVPRTAGDPNKEMVYILPRPGQNKISDKDTICNPAQTIGSQKPDFPALTAAPKDQIALQYLENGHVTKLEVNRSVGGGYVFIYGTKKPSNDDTFNKIHRVWNTEGTGGDKRGKLLATRYYDDSRCYQDNPAVQLSIDRAAAAPLAVKGPDLSCQTDVQLPDDAGTDGTYTLYWVWEWPKVSASGDIIAPETYTACLDVKMTSKRVPDAGPFIAKQPYQSMAIAEQLKTQILIDPKAKHVMNTISIDAEQKMPLTTPAAGTVPTAAPQVPPPTAPKEPAPKEPAPKEPAPKEPTPPKAPAPKPDQPKPSKPIETGLKGFITVTVEKPTTKTIIDYITIFPSPSPTDSASPQEPTQEPTLPSVTTITTVIPVSPAPSPSPSAQPPTPGPGAGSGSGSNNRPIVRPFLPGAGQSEDQPSEPPSPSASASASEPIDAPPSTTSKSACTRSEDPTEPTKIPGGVFTEPAESQPPVNGRHRRRYMQT